MNRNGSNQPLRGGIGATPRRLKIGDRCAIEWFDGPHKINGKGTYEFLHKHLNWPAPKTP